MSLTKRKGRFFNYPEPQRGPDVPYSIERKPSPALRGPGLVIAAFLMEWVRFIRQLAWHNAGFGSLRKIREHLEPFEPRFEPTVYPLPLSEEDARIEGQEAQLEQLIQESHPRRSALGLRLPSAADYRQLYLSGQLTPTDVVQTILPLIRKDISPPGKHSTAWREVQVEMVLKAAEASTLRYQRKESLGPLDGVPTGIKDDYDKDGYATTLGTIKDYAGEIAEGDSNTSWIVRELEEAGAIILGKLHMHEYGLDTTGNNPIQGTPLNPFNPGYYTGGSSSGPAYAVSSGLIPIALGSDGGGSIRIPSSYCSVFGLKPSHARLTTWPGPNHSPTCAVQGPLAIDMESLATLYHAISKPHPTTQFPPLRLQPSPPATKILGIYDAWFSRSAAGAQGLVRSLVGKLVSEYGYEVVSIDIPFVAEGQMAHAMTVLTDAATLLPDTAGITPANKIMLSLGRTTPSTDYLLAQKLRGLISRHLAYLWQKYPGMLIITPTTACAGSPIRGGSSELRYGVNDANYTLQSMEYVWLANFCGLPALSVPAGYVVPEGSEGAGTIAAQGYEGKVPVGLMATGEWCAENSLLSFGFDAEAASNGRRSVPPVWEDIIAQSKVEARTSIVNGTNSEEEPLIQL